MCKTEAGVSCELLTITDPDLPQQDPDKPQQERKRKGVVISARVHPGETVGSWMMRGILFFLTDPENEEAALLRKNFVFKIIPMLNPDGVINGNYRCSLVGCDLNRRWKFPSKVLHPTIYHCKKLIRQMHQERGVVMYCDLHGHSRKPNVFMYGCNNPKDPAECRLFPLLLSKINKIFEFSESKFGV
jgi:cytosolic carboxypeptidase protein 2/3